jgi:hypothetical protein
VVLVGGTLGFEETVVDYGCAVRDVTVASAIKDPIYSTTYSAYARGKISIIRACVTSHTFSLSARVYVCHETIPDKNGIQYSTTADIDCSAADEFIDAH